MTKVPNFSMPQPPRTPPEPAPLPAVAPRPGATAPVVRQGSPGMQPVRGSKSSELLRRLRPSSSRQTLHEGAGGQASRVYQQWRSQVEAQYGLPAWKRSQQDLAKGIEFEMKNLIVSKLLARLQNPTDAGVAGTQEEIKRWAGEAEGTSLRDLVRLAGLLQKILGKEVLQELPETARKSLETAALVHEAVGALARSSAMQLIHEDGTCVGTVDENLKAALLLKEAGRYIEQYQQKHEALPSLETLQAWVAQCDEEATKAATNREWLSGLSEKVFEECCPLLKKRDEASKRWLSTGERPAFYIARAHLQAVVEDSLPDILRTSLPHKEEAARDFDKEVQDRMSLWVTTAWALPGVLGKWKSHQEALKKAKQSDAAQPKLSGKASAYLAEMRQACNEKLKRLRQRDGTSDSDNVVLVASLDEKLKRKLLQKRVMAKVTGAWRGGGMPEGEARALMEDVEWAATAYAGTINIPLRERLLERKMADFAKAQIKEGNDQLIPRDMESKVEQMYRDATKEATDPWITKITDQLIGECLAECKRQIQQPGKDVGVNSSLPSYPKYNMKHVEENLKQSVRAAVDDILKKLQAEGFSPAQKGTWVEFNLRFGKQRKLKIDGALVADGYRTPGVWWTAVEETAKRRGKSELSVAGPVLLHAAGLSLKKAMEKMSEQLGPGEQDQIRNFKKNLPAADLKIWEEIFESPQSKRASEEMDDVITKMEKMEKRLSVDTKTKIMRLSAAVPPSPDIEE